MRRSSICPGRFNHRLLSPHRRYFAGVPCLMSGRHARAATQVQPVELRRSEFSAIAASLRGYSVRLLRCTPRACQVEAGDRTIVTVSAKRPASVETRVAGL